MSTGHPCLHSYRLVGLGISCCCRCYTINTKSVLFAPCRAHEAARQRSLPYKAWQWVTTTLPNRVRRLTNKSRWSADAELPQHQEQQHLLLQLQQDGVAMSDKHLHDIADPLAAADMLDPAAAAGGTSGGASVVVSRSSRGHGRGQVSSCATSSEGFGGGAGAGTANSLARASLASHATQLSYLPTDPADLECLMAQADHKIALKKQEVSWRNIMLQVTPGQHDVVCEY